MADIHASLESIQNTKQLVILLVQILDEGLGIEDLPKAWDAITEARELAASVKLSIDEVKDLDPTEIGTLSSASYIAVMEIIEAVKAMKK